MTTVEQTRTTDRELLDEQGVIDEPDFSGWWCIQTAPWPCPREGCMFVAGYCTAAHLIVVWPAQDDRALLSVARDCREAGRAPRIVEYEVAMGPCIPYDMWRGMGKPVHGIAPLPEGWDGRTRNRL